ncbi:thiosulfate sulfurtransferase GlpE [Agaribacter marinus]|uniref:Thiosulfate sulfurtransferase GlpE n=1 Tax=Agaribacter marinus TaxID=1431249 RepID=A0AA37WGP1_9ALTE|nr:thiosulfate sulfurtransferase GlpE [Agaribacter marinus]GLR69122.1 thiosulfate sulfurtransferase GlpE [Agaribacter marinus]
MEQFGHISPEQTKQRLDKGEIKIVDIRDDQSFELGHIPNSFHLTNGSLVNFMNENDFDTPVVVCCYHGISSQQAAQYLIHQGFEEVYSMDGGFEAWRANYAFDSGQE